MNWKTWCLLFLALVAGFFAAYGVKMIFFVDRAPLTTDESNDLGLKERLLVAKGNLAAGTELNASNVRLTLTPEDRVPRDGLFSFNGVTGRRISRDLKDGEPISLYDLDELERDKDASVGFVPPGCSVVPIEISSATKENGNRNYLSTTKLNKMVKTGDVVDIQIVKEAPSQADSMALPRLTTETIASDVSVFAVSDERRFNSDGSSRVSTISTLLTSKQLESVRKASEEGKLRLVLRNHESGEEDNSGDALAPINFSYNAFYPSVKEKEQVAEGLVADENKSASSSLVESIATSEDISMSDGAFERFGDAKRASKGVSKGSLINSDFAIALEGIKTPKVQNDEKSVGSKTPNDRADLPQKDFAKWNDVDFDSEKEEASSENSDLQDAFWLGERSFRPREPVQASLEEQVASVSSPTDENIESVSTDETDQRSEASVPIDSDASEDSQDKDKDSDRMESDSSRTGLKKYSPFVTVSSKRGE